MDETTKKEKVEIDFYQVKLPNYRVYHVDGVFGGLTPRGLISLECYLERRPLPARVRHIITESGQVGAEVERDSEKSGILREVECGLMLDIKTAESLADWLNSKIEEYHAVFNGGDTSDSEL